MLSYLARVAKDRKCALMEWSSLAWNEAAKQFYLHLGAEAEERWCQLQEEIEASA